MKLVLASIFALLLGLSFSLRPTGAEAATFNIVDEDVAGLIAAINAANANAGPHIINLAPAGSYTLSAPIPFVNIFGIPDSAGLPQITSQITVNGNGATIQRSSLAGTPDFRILTTFFADLTLDGLTIRGGRGGYGAGVEKVGGNLRLLNSTVTENDGGNEGEGAGIFNRCGTVTVVNSTISRNRSFGAFGGGGVLNFSHICPATITIINSTIFENQADGPPGSQGRGDAVADGFSPPGSVVLKNSIVASPTQGLGIDCYAFVPASLGHNIASDASCGLTGAGDLNSTDPLLGPLAHNGATTQTHAPLPGSPAIDAVPIPDCADATGTPIATDQRGVTRPQGASCDVGAYEVEVAAEIIVAIDIKPGSFPNSINLGSAGVVPVAILSSATFDATQVDPGTVVLAGATVRLIGKGSKYSCRPQDVNSDALIDLLCHIETAEFAIQSGESAAVLKAKTFGGQAIRGEDLLSIVP